MSKETEEITKIVFHLQDYLEHYPTGAVAYDGNGEMVDSDYCDTKEEFQEFVDRNINRCRLSAQVEVIIDPRDIEISNVVEMAKEIGHYAYEALKKKGEKR